MSAPLASNPKNAYEYPKLPDEQPLERIEVCKLHKDFYSQLLFCLFLEQRLAIIRDKKWI